MAHHHQPTSGKRIFWVTLLNAGITLTEIIGGLLSGSLSLLSDAIHNLSDTVSIAFSYVAQRIGAKGRTPQKTYGYKRAEILAAFVNAVVLIGLSIFLLIEAIERFFVPETIDGNLMLIVALIGLVANLVSVLLLQQDAHHSLNIRSSYLHLLSDTLSSVGVILGALLIRFFQIYWIDPLITLLVSLYIMKEAYDVVKETVGILMQSAPELDYETIAARICQLPGIENVHHLHAWQIDEATIIFDAHILVKDQAVSDIENLYDTIAAILKEYGISHVTLQPEVYRDQREGLFHLTDES